MLKIITWNVNSIRSRLENVRTYIELCKPDILLLQELKCTEEQFPFEYFDDLNYNIVVKAQKTYNSVAIFSKFPLYAVEKELPLYDIDTEDNEARYIEACFDYDNKQFKVASIYVPNGGPNADDIRNDVKDLTTTERFDYKIKFYRRLLKHFDLAIKNKENVFFGGDFNTCPEIIDMYSVKKDGDICCHYKERDEFVKFIKLGMVDTYRYLNPTKQEFSWWNYRANGWLKNQGLRLDVILSTPESLKLVKKCEIHAIETRGKDKPSDHVPVYVELK